MPLFCATGSTKSFDPKLQLTIEISSYYKKYRYEFYRCNSSLHLVLIFICFCFLWRCKQEKCTLSIRGNAAVGWHAVAITLEDFAASTTNFQMATPFSHVSLQFLVYVTPSSGPCNRVPVLIGQTPNDGSCEEVSEGDTFYSVIEAKHIDSSRR